MQFLAEWRRSVPAGRIFGPVLGVWLLWLGLAGGVGVRLASWRAQRVSEVLFWSVPLLLLALALLLRRPILRWMAALFFAAITPLVLAIFGSCLVKTSFALPKASDPYFDPIAREAVDGSELVLYRSDCGALCHYSLHLRQERLLAPGIKIVRRLGTWEKSLSGTISQIEPRAFRITIQSDGSRLPEFEQVDVTLTSTRLWP